MGHDTARTSGIADVVAWLRLAPLLTEYLPFPSGEMPPTSLVAVLDEVLLGARTVLLECGCGSSSVVVARLLARRGFGRLLSLQHDERRAAFVGSQLRREGLSHVASVVQLPLAPHPAAVGGANWYAPKQLYDQVSEYVDRHGLIDLLLVDGPDSVEGDLARYPALPVLHGALAPGAAILVNDPNRQVLARWQQEFALRFTTQTTSTLATAVLAP